MIKPTSLALAAAATFAFSAADAATPAGLLQARPQHLALSTAAPPLTHATADLLYDQMDHATGDGAWSQNLEPMYDAYDNEAADDFVVTNPDGWQVEQFVFPVAVINLFGDPVLPETVNVKVLGDLAGKPNDADVRCNYDEVAAQFDGTTDYALLTVDLPTVCMLPAGRYWLGMQGNLNLDNEGLFYWTDRGVQSHTPAQWRNPGDGWESGCSEWSNKTDCDQGEGVDMLFQVRGTAVVPAPPDPPALPPQSVPTLSEWALLSGAGALGLLGLLGLRRRQRG